MIAGDDTNMFGLRFMTLVHCVRIRDPWEQGFALETLVKCNSMLLNYVINSTMPLKVNQRVQI